MVGFLSRGLPLPVPGTEHPGAKERYPTHLRPFVTVYPKRIALYFFHGRLKLGD